MTLEANGNANNQIITGAMAAAFGESLGLTPDEVIELRLRKLQRDEKMQSARKQQRAVRARGGRSEGNTLYNQDPGIQELDANERRFQQDFPIRDADLLSMGEYGENEADLQQVSSDRIGNVKQVDQSGIGDSDRGAKVFNRARRDLLPQKVNAQVEIYEKPGPGLPDVVKERVPVSGENQPNQRVAPELRYATMLQEQGLAQPEREGVPYKTSKSGQKRRNFGRVLKDADGNVVKERMARVKRARGTGQTLNPEDIISIDKYDTAVRSVERGIGNDGPTEISRPVMSSSRPVLDAYNQLVDAVQTGQVDLDDVVTYPGRTREFDNKRTVREVLARMEDSMGGAAENSRIKGAAASTAISDMKMRRENARRQLRQIAIQAKAEGNPLTKQEAIALLADLSNPKERTDIKAERAAIGNIASQGSTREVIGETTMSDEAWKSKATKQIPTPPIRSAAQQISNAPVFAEEGPQGVVGYSVGEGDQRRFIGEVNRPDSAQSLNVPSNQQNLINFITENLQYDDKGALKPAVITSATQAFTDAASKLSQKGWGAGVENIPTGIHSLADAQVFTDRLIQRGLENETSFSRYNAENPGQPLKVPTGETPTVSDLMSTMKVDKATQGRLSNALYQMALAEGVDINQAGKQRYAARQGSYQPVYRPEGSGTVNLDLRRQGINAVDLPNQNITFDSPAGFFYDGTEVAYVPNSKRARMDGENVNIQAALRNITLPDGSKPDSASTQPFIGAVAGEGERPMQYRKGFGPGVSLEQGYEDLERSMVKGKRKFSQARVDSNVSRARALEGRQAAHEERKYYDQMRQAANSLGADIELEAERRQDNRREARSRDKVLKSIATGSPLPGRQTELSIKQPIREAPVPRSIAPDPWAETGPAQRPVAEPIQRAASPQLALPYGVQTEGRMQGPTPQPMGPAPARERQENNVRSFGSTGEVNDDIRRIRKTRQRSGAAVQAPQPDDSTSFRTREQMTDAVLNEMTKATGYNVRNAGRDLENIRTNPKYQRGRRIGYGATAGIGALGTILNMRDDEEQEQFR